MNNTIKEEFICFASYFWSEYGYCKRDQDISSIDAYFGAGRWLVLFWHHLYKTILTQFQRLKHIKYLAYCFVEHHHLTPYCVTLRDKTTS
jgi:hypothetical protein